MKLEEVQIFSHVFLWCIFGFIHFLFWLFATFHLFYFEKHTRASSSLLKLQNNSY